MLRHARLGGGQQARDLILGQILHRDGGVGMLIDTRALVIVGVYIVANDILNGQHAFELDNKALTGVIGGNIVGGVVEAGDIYLVADNLIGDACRVIDYRTLNELVCRIIGELLSLQSYLELREIRRECKAVRENILEHGGAVKLDRSARSYSLIGDLLKQP